MHVLNMFYHEISFCSEFRSDSKPLCYVAGIILLNFQPRPPSLLVYAIIMDEQADQCFRGVMSGVI